jgi:hypothetical protein
VRERHDNRHRVRSRECDEPQSSLFSPYYSPVIGLLFGATALSKALKRQGNSKDSLFARCYLQVRKRDTEKP